MTTLTATPAPVTQIITQTSQSTPTHLTTAQHTQTLTPTQPQTLLTPIITGVQGPQGIEGPVSTQPGPAGAGVATLTPRIEALEANFPIEDLPPLP